MEPITKNLLNILFDKPYKIPVEIKLSSPLLQQLTGAFAVKPKFNMYFTVEDGRLAAQASMQPKTVLLAEKQNYFYAEEAKAGTRPHPTYNCRKIPLREGCGQ